MAGDDDGAGGGAEGVLEFVAEPRGEVVGGFVEQEELWGAGHQEGQGEPAALADGEVADPAVEVGRGQQAEGGQRDAFGVFGAFVLRIRDRFDNLDTAQLDGVGRSHR